METIHDSTLFIALIILLAISAFFSISETSMVALNRYRLKHLVQSGHTGARLASQLLARTDKFLGMVLFGNNLLNVATALVMGEIAIRYLGNSQAALLVATAAATFAILVFSEITPKVLGAAYPLRIALPASYLLVPLLRIAQPVVWFVNVFVQALLWLLRLRPAESTGEHKLSVEELRMLVLETGYLPQKHQSILLNLFDLEAITVNDVMVPRNHIEAIDLDAPLDDIRQQIATAHHRRLLVYHGRPDEVVGTLRVRSVLNLVQNEELTKERLREIIREPSFVPVGTPLFSQLHNFQEEQDRVSLVVDEYGELMGLVTMEDILEEIIGEFTTQSPLQTQVFAKQADGSVLVEGSTLLRDLNRKLGFDFPLDGPKTLNGLIVEYLRDIPEPNTSVKIAGHPLEIVQTQDRMVKAVRIVPPAASEGRPGVPSGEK
ncbi:MAG: HlyC/CorC family transporter [Betaproteobacteria bacterium]|nr:HlyC/CorC family transporter [Betaproteobacteria bacterium]